jgi:hypothetical protein
MRADDGESIVIETHSPTEVAIIEEARRRLATPGPRYTSAEVEARLQRLNEIAQREELDENRVRVLLRKMRAGNDKTILDRFNDAESCDALSESDDS